MGDRPASLNPKAVDRIGAHLRRLYSEGSESPMTETISDLLRELEEPKPGQARRQFHRKGNICNQVLNGNTCCWKHTGGRFARDHAHVALQKVKFISSL
jgi:hypothetical protein